MCEQDTLWLDRPMEGNPMMTTLGLAMPTDHNRWRNRYREAAIFCHPVRAAACCQGFMRDDKTFSRW